MMVKPYIICVDDERVILDSLKEQIKTRFGESYHIEIAESGKEAIGLYGELQKQGVEVPLVICDYIMPDIKGDMVLKDIYRLCTGTAPVTVLLTGQASLKGIKAAINEAQISKFIAKPWEEESLYAHIEHALDFFYKEKRRRKDNRKLKETNDALVHALETKALALAPGDYKGCFAGNIKTVNELAYKVTQEVSESLRSIKNGIDTIQKLKGNIENGDDERLGRHLKSFDAYFSNISDSISHLVSAIEDHTAGPAAEMVPYTGFDNMLNEATKVRNETLGSITELTNRLNEIEKLVKKYPQKVVAWDDEEMLLFNLDEVLFFSSENRNIVVVTKKGKYKVRESMSELEKNLKEHNFFRCHKGYLINLKYVVKIVPWLGYDSYMSTVEGYGGEIPVSRNYIKEMKRVLGI